MLCLCSHAQQYIVHVEKYDLQNGLSNRQVNCIHKDRRGMLWIGTQYGLNSYDGYSFKFYTREKDSLPFNDVFRIEEDADGSLLLFGAPGLKQVVAFNPITHSVKLLGDSYSLFIRYSFAEEAISYEGKLYLNTTGVDSLWIYSAKDGVKANAIQDIGSYKLLHIHNDEMYVLDRQNRILCIAANLSILDEYQLPYAVKPYSLGPKEKGLLLRETNNYNSNSAQYLSFPFTFTAFSNGNLPPRDISRPDFMFDPEIDSMLWRQGKLFDKQQQLVSDFVALGYKDLAHVLRAVYRDENNVLWLGGDFGLYRISMSRNKFKNYLNTTPFNEDNRHSYRGIYVSGQQLFMNNESSGLYQVNAEDAKLIGIATTREFGGFTCLVPDGKGHLLQGCFYGLNKIDLKTKAAKLIRVRGTDCRIWCLQAIGNDRYLAGTETGLFVYDNNKEQFAPYKQYNTYNELQTAFVLSIVPDSKTHGNYWLCTNRGLYALNIDKGIIGIQQIALKRNTDLTNAEVFSIYQDNDSVIWLGTNQGLVKWERATANSMLYTRSDGLSDNTVYAIQGDKHGNLWLSSNYGLMRFDKATTRVKTYLVEDGIANNEFNRIASYVDDNDRFYLGTLNGITSFNPNDFATDTTVLKSPFVITSFFKFDDETDKIQEHTASLLSNYSITMDVDDKLFSLEYALLNYSYTKQNLYAYKIDGVNDEWVYSKEHNLSFNRLPYGTHTLHIKAKGLNTTWSDEIQISIDVLKPFYLQWWFFLLVVVLVVAVFYAYVAYRTYSLKREQQRLEEEVSRKTLTIMQQADALKLSLHQKELLLKEIHHRVKNNLQVISGLLSLQGSSSGNAEVITVMNEGKARIKSMALIHQMLYQNDDLQKLNFKEYLKQLLNNILAGAVRSGDVAVDIKADDIWFDIDTAIPLGLIVNEFATNSIKHAFTNGKGSITISVSETETNRFMLVYKDNGKGLPKDFDIANAKTLGLKLVKMLSAQLKGQLHFKHENGTTIALEFNSNWKTQ